jgi:hypothetical protein
MKITPQPPTPPSPLPSRPERTANPAAAPATAAEDQVSSRVRTEANRIPLATEAKVRDGATASSLMQLARTGILDPATSGKVMHAPDAEAVLELLR